nr:MAG TPA: hypothetical protein [Bacteriophage sp.]
MRNCYRDMMLFHDYYFIYSANCRKMPNQHY